MGKPSPGQPIFARLSYKTRTYTEAELHVFGRKVAHVFKGDRHHAEAVRWVNDMNQHIDAEWMAVRGTAAAIVEKYVAALLLVGVPPEKIDAAVQRIRAGDGD